MVCLVGYIWLIYVMMCLNINISLFALHIVDHSVEYNVSYIYHALYAYFDRDNVGLKGFAKWVSL